MEEAKQEVNNIKQMDGQYATIRWLIDHLVPEGERFTMNQSYNPVIFMRFQNSATELLEKELRHRQETPPRQAMAFAIGGVFALLQDWIVGGRVEEKEDICKLMNEFAGKILE